MEWESLDYDINDDANEKTKAQLTKGELKQAVQSVARPKPKKPTEQKSSSVEFDDAKWNGRKACLQKDFLVGNCLPAEKKALLSPEAEALAGSPAITATDSGLLCIPCKKANVNSEWGRGTAGVSEQGLKYHFIKRHVDSKTHRRSVEMMLECSDSMSPSKEEFSDARIKVHMNFACLRFL